MLSNRNEWWVPGKIVEVRHRLKGYWQASGPCCKGATPGLRL